MKKFTLSRFQERIVTTFNTPLFEIDSKPRNGVWLSWGFHNFIESNHASVEVSKPQPVSLRKHRTTNSSGSCQNYQKANFLAWWWHNHNNTTYYILVGLIANIFYGFKLPRWQRTKLYLYDVVPYVLHLMFFCIFMA